MSRSQAQRRDSSPPRESANGPRGSSTSVRDLYTPQAALNPLFPRDADGAERTSSPSRDRHQRTHRVEPTPLSRLAATFVRVPLNNYAACEHFVQQNPRVLDTDRQAYVEQAIRYLILGNPDSRRLAFSCLEKLLILRGCQNDPQGTAFISRLRSKDPKRVAEFNKSFTKLRLHCEEQAEEDESEELTEREASHTTGRYPQQPSGQLWSERDLRNRHARPVPQARDAVVDSARPPQGRHQSSSVNTDTRSTRPPISNSSNERGHSESVHWTDDVGFERPTQSPQARGSIERIHSTSEEPDPHYYQYAQEPRSRHAAGPLISGVAREPEVVGESRLLSSSRNTTLPMRSNERQNVNQLPEPVNIGRTALDTSTSDIRHRSGASSNQAQRGSMPSAPSAPLSQIRMPTHTGPASFRGTNTPALDPKFQVIQTNRWDDYFKRGRVFAILTYSANTRNDEMSRWTTFDSFGQPVYTHVLRMVVVGKARGRCWAIPINTYGRQGLSKPGLSRSNIEAHAIIHTVNTQARWLQGEPRSPKRAITIIADNADMRLHAASRINFEKVHTVELNVRVLRIGTVTDETLPWLLDYFSQEIARVVTGSS